MKPSKVWSTYGQKLNLEPTTGRFHASLAFTRAAYEAVDGWQITALGDFDQRFIQRLHTVTVVDPLMYGHDPSYVFRWEDSLAPHGQAYMSATEPENWLSRCQNILDKQYQQRAYNSKQSRICNSKFDVPTAKVFAELVPEVKT